MFLNFFSDGVWLFYRKMANLHYPVYKFWVSHIPIVIIRHPDDIEVQNFI